MGLLDKIKKLFEEPVKQENVEARAITQYNLQKEIETLKKYIENKDIYIKLKLKERISRFDNEGKNIIKVLEGIDLAKRKEYDRVKSIVLQNLSTYIIFLKKLFEDLKKIDEKELKHYFENIFSALNSFSISSNLPYEKATYLIGKEMEDTRLFIKQFITDIKNIKESSSAIIEESNTIDEISRTYEDIKQIVKFDEDMKVDVSKLEEEIKNLEKEKDKLNSDINVIKESEAYKSEMNKNEENIRMKAELDKELEIIKRNIDFKALQKVYHNDLKKADIIKNYQKEFKNTLMSDENISIIELCWDSQKADLSRLKDIKSGLLKPHSKEYTLTFKKIFELTENINKINIDIELKGSKVLEENKKIEKFNNKKDILFKSLKELLSKRNILLNI